MNLEKIHLILFLKPYYNWNAFNTECIWSRIYRHSDVLNLIITGIPSIHHTVHVYR